MNYLREFADDESPYRVRLDDDDRVAYAYLIDGKLEARGEIGIIGDVWLYNVAPAPSAAEWREIGRDGILYARLKPGAKPGWARLAAVDGPCALSLQRERAGGS